MKATIIDNEDDPRAKDGAREYLFDMLGQLAFLARNCGETQVAGILDVMVREARLQEGNEASVDDR